MLRFQNDLLHVIQSLSVVELGLVDGVGVLALAFFADVNPEVRK